MKRLTYIFVAASIILFAAMNYVEYTHLQLISGGLKSPDTQIFGYSVKQMKEWKDALGPNGAQSYITAIPRGFDIIFPIIFGTTIWLLTHAALAKFEKFNRQTPIIQFIAPTFIIAPYIIADYVENETLIRFLNTEESAEILASTAVSVTVTKFAFLALALIILFAFWMAGLKKRVE